MILRNTGILRPLIAVDYGQAWPLQTVQGWELFQIVLGLQDLGDDLLPRMQNCRSVGIFRPDCHHSSGSLSTQKTHYN